MIKELGKDRYRFIVSVGGRGERKRYTKTIECKSKRELKKLYTQFEEECQKTPLSDITVSGLLDAYIEHCKTLGRKATTLKGYEVASERCQTSVGTILAKNCTTYQLEKFVAEMVDNGLSAKTIRNTIGLLSAAYRHAIKIGQLESDPCVRLTLPKGQPREVRVLYMDEIPLFLDAIAECDLNEKCAYELALFCGLRKSEILGLKESDVDIVNALVDIHSTRHRVDGEDVEQDTKTARSTRTLALPDILVLDLAKLMQTHRDFKYTSTDYLIQDGFGNPMGANALASRLERLEKKKGLPHVTLHGLRHTYATMLNASGVDMAMISAELGHSNLSVTANIYTHRFKTPTQASRGIADTVNTIAVSRGTSVAHEAIEKP